MRKCQISIFIFNPPPLQASPFGEALYQDKKLLEFNFRGGGGQFYAQIQNSKFPNTPKFGGPRPLALGGGGLSPGPKISKKVSHTPVGQNLREEIDFLETGCSWPRAVPLRPADVPPPPKSYLYGVVLVLKIL
jgi:hypothetical protein